MLDLPDRTVDEQDILLGSVEYSASKGFSSLSPVCRQRKTTHFDWSLVESLTISIGPLTRRPVLD